MENNFNIKEIDGIRYDIVNGNPIELIKGNIDSNYEFRITEIDYYHIGATQVVHDSKTLSYEKVERVIKLNRINFLKAEKHGGFTDFNVGKGSSVVILHDPTKHKPVDYPTPGGAGEGSGDVDTFVSEELKKMFEEIIGEDAPETEDEMKTKVRSIYEEEFEKKPGNKGIETMLNNIKEWMDKFMKED